MDVNAWNKSEVQSLMDNFISLKIDIDSNRDLARKYSVRGIPYVFIIDANGEIVFQRMSYMDKSQVIKVLKKYSYGTQLVQEDYINYFKNKTGDNALEIAKKYFDMSIYVDKAVRNDFLKIASNYIKKSKNLYKEEGTKNKELEQRELFEKVYKKLLKEKYEKAIKILSKDFKESKLEEKNKEFYSFLYFTAYSKLQDKENAKIWYNKLKEFEGYRKLLMKSRKI